VAQRVTSVTRNRRWT